MCITRVLMNTSHHTNCVYATIYVVTDMLAWVVYEFVGEVTLTTFLFIALILSTTRPTPALEHGAISRIVTTVAPRRGILVIVNGGGGSQHECVNRNSA